MLEVSGLHVAYGAIPAVRGIDLTVGDGEWVAVVGRNGAGKTTTLRAIAGLNAASAGSVRFDERDLTRAAPDVRLRAGVSLVPEGRGTFPDLSVRENLTVGALRRRLPRRQVGEEIDRMTARFPRLADRLDQRAGSLSGGEQQMLAVARGLMSKPKLLLVDEPSLGLAPKSTQELYAFLQELNEGGIAIAVVEQYVELALSFTDRAYVLDKGRVALAGRSEELRASPELLDVYLAAAPERESA